MAVIVILAIIALIAVPIILDLIGNTRVSAAKRSAENYIDAVELYLARSELDTNKVTLERNKKYNVTSSTVMGEKTYPKINDLVEISGSKPTGKEDYVQLNEKGKVIEAELTMNGYKIVIKNGKIVSVTKGDSIPLQSISLNYTEQTMEKDSTFKLIPTFNPENASNQEVTYVSSDESIVTVDAQGIVTAVSTGTTKITVTSKENSTIKAECNITVVVSATGLTVTPETAEIKMGETVQLIGTIEPNNTTTNSLTWSSSNADIASVDSNGLVIGVSKGEVVITATTVNGIESTSKITVKELYKEAILNGAYPEIYSGLTPVIYRDNNWKVADLYSEWYKYNNQEWANAVILKSGITRNIGETVNVDSEVQAMFVWIPRYEYKIEGQYGTHLDGTAGTQELPGEIKVNFLSKSINSATSGYRIHPAFTFGTTVQSGLWIGKFETSTDKNSECYTNASESSCGNSSQIPYIIPDVMSMRFQTLSQQFETSQKMATYMKESSLDTHMLKNDEWGAIAYLSQSRYGKYGNKNFTGSQKELYLNNSSKYYTGRSGANPSGNISVKDIYPNETSTDGYNSYGFYTYDGYLLDNNTGEKTNTKDLNKGAGASTTGNITGIYDMNGGAYEYVMGVLADSSGNPRSGNSNGYNSGYEGAIFNDTKIEGKKFPDSKYYNLYTSTDPLNACNNKVCNGQALSETHSWYNDATNTISATYPWIARSGCWNNSAISGIFYFSNGGGHATGSSSFHIAISKS